MSASRHHSFTASEANAFARPAGVPVDAVGTLDAADLQRIESALLAAILDVQPGRANAVDQLLSDFDAADGAHDDTSSHAARDTGVSRRKQVEELLFAAVLDTHSDRNRALDRIL